MDISRNKVTGQVIRGNLFGNFRQGDWENCLDSEGNILPEYQEYIDQDNLEEAKTDKKKEIEVARDAAIYAPITISTENEGEKTFSAFIGIAGQVALAITNLDKRIANGETSPTIKHPAQDNSQPLLTINDFRLLEAELIARNDYFNQGIDLKAQVDACSTIDELNSINISFNNV